MKREEIITEVERYFVLPGQACSYMVGCEKILTLREKARQALGDRFDLQQFHAGRKQVFRNLSLHSLSSSCSFTWIIAIEHLGEYY